MRDGHTNVLVLVKSDFPGTNQTKVSRPALAYPLALFISRPEVGVLIAAYTYYVTLARGIFFIRDHL